MSCGSRAPYRNRIGVRRPVGQLRAVGAALGNEPNCRSRPARPRRRAPGLTRALMTLPLRLRSKSGISASLLFHNSPWRNTSQSFWGLKRPLAQPGRAIRTVRRERCAIDRGHHCRGAHSARGTASSPFRLPQVAFGDCSKITTNSRQCRMPQNRRVRARDPCRSRISRANKADADWRPRRDQRRILVAACRRDSRRRMRGSPDHQRRTGDGRPRWRHAHSRCPA